LRAGLYDEFYETLRDVLIPFQKPETYGRSILENSSFLVSSAHEDKALHGQGFVARLSGSTAEFLHIWLSMNVGEKPFLVDGNKQLCCALRPVLPGWLFTGEPTSFEYVDAQGKLQTTALPAHSYAFLWLGSIVVVYHNAKRKDTFGSRAATIEKIELTYPHRKTTVNVVGPVLVGEYAADVRDKKVSRVDVYLA